MAAERIGLSRGEARASDPGSRRLAFAVDELVPVRRATRVVAVGDVAIGGDNPIRVQSMTTTDTMDTRATADQVEQLVAAGCELVRITAPSIHAAENLGSIAGLLKRRGLKVPLVADIHFTPNAALIASEHVQKVRVNPGNYADKKKFEIREYSDTQYRDELERVAARFVPLVRRCSELGVAMRIGTNHGSLSDRIVNRYGDTPLGMVESALEFLDVCESESYQDVVFSMKSSNAQVAIQAFRLLAARLAVRAGGEAGYPFHLGVTEAGDGEDARVKSAIGIGSLLEDGLGDTIRVSLTEDPVREIPVATALARRAEARWVAAPASDGSIGGEASPACIDDPYSHARRPSRAVKLAGLAIGGDEPVRVELERRLPAGEGQGLALAERLAAELGRQREVFCEGLVLRLEPGWEAGELRLFEAGLERLGIGLPLALRAGASDLHALVGTRPGARWVVDLAESDDLDVACAAASLAAASASPLEWCLAAEPEVMVSRVDLALAASRSASAEVEAFSVDSCRPVHAVRALAWALRRAGCSDRPIVLRWRRPDGAADEFALLDASIDLGSSLCDGIGDVVSLASDQDAARDVDLAYRVLQGARLRTTRTEYISCPSCGRTLFELEATTARVKKATSHLRGVKIAIMGCIVNGPGEMADADFGYVGAGTGRVNLYVGKEIVERGVAADEAPDRLVDLIRRSGRWQEAAEDG